MKSFIINGQGGVGKDQFIIYVSNYLLYKYKIITINISSVDEIKKLAKEYFSYMGQKTPEWRKCLSDLKDIQTNICNGPFRYMTQKFIDNQNTENLLIFHIREPDEIIKFEQETKSDTILITRGNKSHYGNHADDNIFNYDYNITIDNNGNLDDLQKKAEEFCENYIIDK